MYAAIGAKYLKTTKIQAGYISVVTGFPVYSISFRFGRKNKIRKEYLGTDFGNVIILGFLMADTSSKRQKTYIFS